MFDWDDILIVGDSFAYHRNWPRDWPMALTLMLTNKKFDPKVIPRGQGFSGCAWWSVRKNLLAEIQIKIPKVLIICHTDPNRIPSDFDYGLNFLTVTTDNEDGSLRKPFNTENINSDDIVLAAREYFYHLYSDNFHHWAQTRWYEELDSIIEEYCIDYVVHLHVTEHVFKYQFRNGLISEEKLVPICDDLKNHLVDPLVESYRNHFTSDNNFKIAQSLFKAIENFTPGIRNINLLGK
jgi:hypothetical protein